MLILALVYRNVIRIEGDDSYKWLRSMSTHGELLIHLAVFPIVPASALTQVASVLSLMENICEVGTINSILTGE